MNKSNKQYTLFIEQIIKQDICASVYADDGSFHDWSIAGLTTIFRATKFPTLVHIFLVCS